jgi:biopolymer transport protein ExbB/TolQ
MSKTQKGLIGLFIGVPAFIAFGYFTNAWAAVSLFLVMFADNISQSVVRESR